MAAMFLRQCGFTGSEPVLDPMCGSGTFPIEAAEIAAGLLPGRARAFAFEQLPSFDPAAWERLRVTAPPPRPACTFYGFDRDAGAIRMAAETAARAGVSALTRCATGSIEHLVPPEGPPGLVIVNPPYGNRIGSKAPLLALHRLLGTVLKTRFAGWRVGIVTADRELARATGLAFEAPLPPVLHGGIRIALYRTAPLPPI